MTRAPSGQQFEIRYGEQHATIVEVGGGIRAYSWAGRDVLQPYDEHAMCDGAHGTPLIPWPNRLGDGKYSFDAREYQVGLTEPEKNNAIHGFMRWRPWQATERGDGHVVMAATLFPMRGYPFMLDLRVEYRLDDDGLTVTTRAVNAGDQRCPYGCGQHPYLSPGAGLIDECELELRAGTRIVTDDVRQLPARRETVTGTPFDFREPRRLGTLAIDYAFTDLERDADGRAWLRLIGRDGYAAELWVDESYPLLEAFTADTLEPERRRRGLGAEPMTCPPNGFQTGEGLVVLEPGESHTAAWGARLRRLS